MTQELVPSLRPGRSTQIAFATSNSCFYSTLLVFTCGFAYGSQHRMGGHAGGLRGSSVGAGMAWFHALHTFAVVGG